MIPFIGLFFSAANGHSSHEAGGSRLYNEKDPVCLVKVGSQGNSLRKGEVQFFFPLHCLPNIHIFFCRHHVAVGQTSEILRWAFTDTAKSL